MMRKITIFSACILGTLCIPKTASAQSYYNSDSNWKLGGNFGLLFNQVAQTNWAAGGDNLVGLNLQLNYTANYLKGKHMCDNRLQLEYGFNKTKSDGSKKTADNIYLSSIYGYEIAKNLYLSGTFIYDTQFANGYDYGDAGESDNVFISTFMAPGYLNIGAGITWTPKTWFKLTFNPVAYRGIFVLNKELSDAGQFGVHPGDRYRTEFGANLLAELNKNLTSNINLYSRLALYSNYLEDAQNVDIDWEVKLNMDVNSWITASISTNMIYDDNVKILKDGKYEPRLQFQEILGIGLQFRF